MRREPNRAPSGPSPRFHCCPWHCPSNLQTIKQTPSPAHYQTGTSSHRGLGLEAESSGRSYSVQMRPLVLGAVAGVTERFLTARMLAQVRLLAGVAPQVNLEILKPGKGLLATFKLQKRKQVLVVEKKPACLGLGDGEKNVLSVYLA